MFYKWVFLVTTILTFGCNPHGDRTLHPAQIKTIVFQSVENEDYRCFRIPAIVKTKIGHLLAFAEGRKAGCSDTGDIDLVMKRSIDDGRLWGPLQVIWSDSTNTCGNPAPIVDQITGHIHLLSTWNLGTDHERDIIDGTSQDTRHIYALRSTDNGETWTKPRDITNTVKKPQWTWYATGPGSGIQLSSEKHKGRLLLGCDHIEADTKKYYSHTIYSDDHGVTWSLGGTVPKDQVNECEVAELSDGRVMINMRNYDRSKKFRQTAISGDGGITWTDQSHDTRLIEPICQASLQHVSLNGLAALAFSNPASTDSRVNMTIRTSADDGKSWIDSISIHSGPSAYSDLIQIDEQLLGCLYEGGEKSPYESINFQRLTILHGRGLDLTF